MIDKLHVKTLCYYEKLTGTNAFDFAQRFAPKQDGSNPIPAATDLLHLVFLLEYQLDNKFSMTVVENLTLGELMARLNELTAPPVNPLAPELVVVA